MKLGLFVALLASACTPASTNPVIEVRPVTASVATLPASATSSPDQTIIAKQPLAVPFADGQRWIGHYICPQGDTSLILHVVRVEGREVEAMFEFRYMPQGILGMYKTSGRWDPSTHSITLVPGEWIQQPSGYVSVAMTGVVSGATFDGKIDHPACGAFNLVLNNEDDDDWD